MDLHGFICLLTNTSSIESYDNHEGKLAFYLCRVICNVCLYAVYQDELYQAVEYVFAAQKQLFIVTGWFWGKTGWNESEKKLKVFETGLNFVTGPMR